MPLQQARGSASARWPQVEKAGLHCSASTSALIASMRSGVLASCCGTCWTGTACSEEGCRAARPAGRDRLQPMHSRQARNSYIQHPSHPLSGQRFSCCSLSAARRQQQAAAAGYVPIAMNTSCEAQLAGQARAHYKLVLELSCAAAQHGSKARTSSQGHSHAQARGQRCPRRQS